MKTSRLCDVFLAVIIYVGVSGAADAATVTFDNFGPGDSYANSGYWFGQLGASHKFVANKFTATSSGVLDSLSLGIIALSAIQDTVISLATDNLGTVDSIIWSQTVSASSLSSFGSVLDISSIGGPLLTSGASYWLIADIPTAIESDPGTHAWNVNNINAIGETAYNDDGIWVYQNDLTFAMRVEISSVPIPAAVWLFASGLLGLLGTAKGKSLLNN